MLNEFASFDQYETSDSQTFHNGQCTDVAARDAAGMNEHIHSNERSTTAKDSKEMAKPTRGAAELI